MRERPILFSAPMVRGILDGRKTQMRRVVKPQPVADPSFVGGAYIERRPGRTDGGKNRTAVGAPWGMFDGLCPSGQPGDRLWVRETFADFGLRGFRYRADGEQGSPHGCVVSDPNCPGGCDCYCRWKPSIHMPRWASRITLEVTDVRVERLQAISEADAVAEGMAPAPGLIGDDDLAVRDVIAAHDAERGTFLGMPVPIARFVLLWDSINGDKPGVTNWNANPWVWVVGFRRVTP